MTYKACPHPSREQRYVLTRDGIPVGYVAGTATGAPHAHLITASEAAQFSAAAHQAIPLDKAGPCGVCSECVSVSAGDMCQAVGDPNMAFAAALVGEADDGLR